MCSSGREAEGHGRQCDADVRCGHCWVSMRTCVRLARTLNENLQTIERLDSISVARPWAGKRQTRFANRPPSHTSNYGMSAGALILRITMLACAAVGQSGCFAVPVLLPPARISMGPGVASGQVVQPKPQTAATNGASESSAIASGTSEIVTVRIDVRPLQLFPELHRRTHDLAIGFVVDQIGTGSGPYLSASGGYLRYDHTPVLFDHIFGSESGQFRMNLGLIADILQRSDNGALGSGVAAVAGVELLKWSTSEFSHSDRDGGIVGSGFGQIGIGFEVETKARFLPGMNYRATTAMLTFRTPGIIALVYGLLHRD